MIFTEDASSQSVIEQIAAEMDFEIYPVGQGAPLAQYVKTLLPIMLIVDLTGSVTDWLFRHISEIKNSNLTFPIVAIVKLQEESMRSRLQSAGVKSVLTKPELERLLPKIIENVLKMY